MSVRAPRDRFPTTIGGGASSRYRPVGRLLAGALLIGVPRVSGGASRAGLDDGLARGPYLEAVAGTSAYVCWRAESAAPGKVEYRRARGPQGAAASGLLWSSEPRAARDHCLKLKGLEPSAAYEYRVALSSGATPWHRFRAAEGPRVRALHFAVLGDSGSGGDAQLRVARRLEKAAPDFILHVGDVVYNSGADADYDARYFAPYRALLDRAPVYIGIGNHDYGNYHRSAEEGRRWLEENFLVIHRLPPRSGGAPSDEPTYYSFDRGPAHFAALDANADYSIPAAPPLGPGSAQLAWLAADLAASKAPWKFVFFHEPVYSTGHHGDTDGFKKWLAPVLEKGGVDVVFQGHDHDYERSVPLRGGARGPGGVVYIVAGCGGAPLNGQNQAEAWSAVFQERFGFADVRLEGNRLSLQAVGDDGRVFDRWEKTK